MLQQRTTTAAPCPLMQPGWFALQLHCVVLSWEAGIAPDRFGPGSWEVTITNFDPYDADDVCQPARCVDRNNLYDALRVHANSTDSLRTVVSEVLPSTYLP